jgi:alcohol dehydrogenase (cytochrome c)
LYSNSVVALDAATGELEWHFQFTPHDEHDRDSAQTPILAELIIDGELRKVICWANRNGFYYVLDRTNGQFLVGAAFVDLNWAMGLDSRGRPVLASAPESTSASRFIKPSVAGATNWQNAAFDPVRNLVFIPAVEGGSVYTKSQSPGQASGDGIYAASAGSMSHAVTLVVKALDAATGKRRWERVAPENGEVTLAYSGLLATAGGIVFGAANGAVFALEAATGEEVWRLPLGGPTKAPPITFTVDGEQVIGIAAGSAFFVFGL